MQFITLPSSVDQIQFTRELLGRNISLRMLVPGTSCISSASVSFAADCLEANVESMYFTFHLHCYSDRNDIYRDEKPFYHRLRILFNGGVLCVILTADLEMMSLAFLFSYKKVLQGRVLNNIYDINMYTQRLLNIQI